MWNADCKILLLHKKPLSLCAMMKKKMGWIADGWKIVGNKLFFRKNYEIPRFGAGE